MDKQEMLNIAVTKVWEQGEQCMNQFGTCCYYDGNGNRCAVGWLLPEEVAREYSDAGDVYILARDFKNLSEYVGKDLDFLSSLQSCHDDAVTTYGEGFKGEFMDMVSVLAEEYDLTVPNLV